MFSQDSQKLEDNLSGNTNSPNNLQEQKPNNTNQIIVGGQSDYLSLQHSGDGASNSLQNTNSIRQNPNNLKYPGAKKYSKKLYIIFGSSIILIALVLIFFLFINKSHNQFSSGSQGKQYTDSLTGFKINPPSSWVKDEVSRDSNGVYRDWAAPNNGKDGTGYFEADIYISISPSSDKNIDNALDTYITQETSSSYFYSYKVLSRSKTKVNGTEAYILKSTQLVSTGSDVSYTITSTEIFELNKGVVYDVSGDIADGFQKNYSQAINKSLYTFMPGHISGDQLAAQLKAQSNADSVNAANQLPVDNSIDFSDLISQAKSFYFSQGPLLGITPSTSDENNVCENFSQATTINRYECWVEFYKVIDVSSNFSAELQAMTNVENQAKSSGFSDLNIDASPSGTPASDYYQYYSDSIMSSSLYCDLSILYNAGYSPPQISYDLACRPVKQNESILYTSTIPKGFKEGNIHISSD